MNRFLHCVLLTMLFSAFTTLCLAEPASVSVTKEIVLTPGEPFHPYSIIGTPDDNIIVTATTMGKTGIVVKLDKTGKVIWEFREQQYRNSYSDGADPANMAGAVVLPNGDIFVCGNDTITDISRVPLGKGQTVTTKGKFIKLNPQGQLIEKKNILPTGSDEIHLSSITKCGRWGDGIYVLGSGARVFPYEGDASQPHRNKVEEFFWLMKLDISGKVLWEKNIPTKVVLLYFPAPQLLKNGDLVISGRGNGGTTSEANPLSALSDFVVVTQDGTIKAQRQMENHNILISRISPDQPLVIGSGDSGSTVFSYLDNSLTTIKQQRVNQLYIMGFVNYLNEKNQLVAFSELEKSRSDIRGIITTDLNNNQIKKTEIPGCDRGDSRRIQDAIVLNSAGVFAFTNQIVGHLKSCPDFALGITLINIK